MPKARLVKPDWGMDAMNNTWKHVEENIDFWLSKTKNYRENTLKRYARLYKGTPDSPTKDTPWPNAANNIIQVIATHCDQLLSRVMSIYMVEPLWTAKILGDLEDDEGEKQRQILEEFMSEMAMSTTELDFYRIEQAWFSSAIRNGTGIIKLPWQYAVEQQIVFLDGIDENASTHKFDEFIKYDGPKPENVPLNKFVNNLQFSKLEDSNLKFEIVTLNRYQLEERKELGIYNSEDIDKILGQPDRQGPDVLQENAQKSSGITQSAGENNQGAEYDIIECWFTYWHNKQKFSLFAQCHRKSETRLGMWYNYYPKNMCIYEDSKLAYDDDNWLGYGLAEMLEGYQEEISTAHNQRTDAGTLNNSTAFRVNKNSKLRSVLTFYPGIMIPADKDEIERLDTSNAHASDTTQETLTNAYAKERSGVDPAIGGTGGGIVNPKRGVYSSQGTFAVMQQQNNRTSLRTSDMRSAHVRAGNKFLQMYSHFGIGSKLGSFGKEAEVLKKSFENIKSGKLGLLIRPTTASINKEVEKQNDVLLAQLAERLYAADAQVIQLLTTQQIPEDLKQYYIEVLRAKNALMHHIFKDFGHDDAARLIPVPTFLKENKDALAGRNKSLPGIIQGQGNITPSLPTRSMEGNQQLPQ